MRGSDDSDRLLEAVRDAREAHETLTILGHGSKSFLLPSRQGSLLATTEHNGVLEYVPDELVITVRAGTTLAELEETVGVEGQMVASEPPRFSNRGTVGGAIAAGLSGPARPWYGSLRDSLLGVELINGRGERLQFGGKVIKNVAGFDVTRLMAGSFGTLGVLLSASLKLMPRPQSSMTISLECSEIDAHQLLLDLTRKPSSLSATCFHDNLLTLRFSGAASAVESDIRSFPQSTIADSDVWQKLRDQSHAFFDANQPLWRVSIERGSLFQNVNQFSMLSEWGGSLVWLKTDSDETPDLHGSVGEATGFRNVPYRPRALAKYSARIKNAFDPQGIFNTGVVV